MCLQQALAAKAVKADELVDRVYPRPMMSTNKDLGESSGRTSGTASMLQKRSSQATYTNHSVAAKALRSSAVCGKLYCWRSHTHATNYYEVVGARNQLNLSTNYYEVVGARNQLNLFVNSS